MSFSPTYQNLSALSPLYFKDSDEKLEFINKDKFNQLKDLIKSKISF